jgi:hypothetical protein
MNFCHILEPYDPTKGIIIILPVTEALCVLYGGNISAALAK